MGARKEILGPKTLMGQEDLPTHALPVPWMELLKAARPEHTCDSVNLAPTVRKRPLRADVEYQYRAPCAHRSPKLRLKKSPGVAAFGPG